MSTGDLKAEAAGVRASNVAAPDRWERVYRIRARLYVALLLFVVVLGLPQVIVPAWRARLRERLAHLGQALSGVPAPPAPVVLGVGENREPFPPQYERAIEPLPKVSSGLVFVSGATVRAGGAPRESGEASQPEPASSAAVGAQGRDSGGGEGGEPEFLKGPAQKEAYDILLQVQRPLADLAAGSNPALRFRGWDAAQVDEETYWVRITFSAAGNGRDEVYIWQVKPRTRSTNPLNYNARALAVR